MRIFLVIFLLLCSIVSCKKEKKVSPEYIKVEPVGERIIFKTSKIVSSPYYIKRLNEDCWCYTGKTYACFYSKSSDKVRKIDSGIGPNEIYKANVLKSSGNNIVVNSYLLPWLYYISPDLTERGDHKVKVVKLKHKVRFGDFVEASEDIVFAGSIDWLDGMIVKFNSRTGELLRKFDIKPIRKKVMNHFNASAFTATKYKDKMYFAESLKPVIRSLDLNTEKFGEEIHLNPPFYLPMPEEYKARKYDNDYADKWMASWTSLEQVFIKQEWMIVRYMKGYGHNFAYEIFNLKNPSFHYYMDFSNIALYDFSLVDDGMSIEYL